jgi:thiol-disulfide isomerase/thioredoxin
MTLTCALLVSLPGMSQQQTDSLPYMSDKTLPAFNLLLVDSTTTFNTKDIPSGKPTVLLYFSPDCEHCQHETEEILKNMDSLRNVHFIFITALPFDKMKNFYFYYKLGNYKNITLGKDQDYFFSRHFGSQYVPYLAIYNRNKKLVKVFDGGTKVSNLIQLTQK